MKYLPLVFITLAACSIPDEVGVGANANQYDYLGGDGIAPYFETQTGEGFGVNAWATWRLRPQRVELVQSEHSWVPPKAEPIGPTFNFNDEPLPPPPTVIDEIGNLGSVVDSWSAKTLVFICFALVVLSIVAYVFRRYVPILCKLIPQKDQKNSKERSSAD